MGGGCSKGHVRNQIGIVGDGNSAFILNDITFNISQIMESAIVLTAKHYQTQWIGIHFASVVLICLFTPIIILCQKSYKRDENGTVSHKKATMYVPNE